MIRFYKGVLRDFFILLIPAVAAFVALNSFLQDRIEDPIVGICVTQALFIITLIYNISKFSTFLSDHVGDFKTYDNVVNSIFEVFALAFHFQANNPNIAIHYFCYHKDNNDEFLVKDRRYGLEEINCPIDYSLEKCRLNANGIVMCKAFKENRVIFENLPYNHSDQYDTDIKGYDKKSVM